MTKFINSFYIILIVYSTWSCNSIIEDINRNPNNQTDAPYANVLVGAEVGNMIFQTGETARRAGIFSGQYTGIQRQHLGFSNYTLTTGDFDALWYAAYVNTYRNALLTEQKVRESGIEGVSVGITKVLQAMTIGTLTSLFEDVPFDQANYESENPEFENQEQVYSKVQTLLDEAISHLASGNGRPVLSAEIYFDGDPEAWAAVAHTLKARFYMHTGEYEEAYAAAQLGIMTDEHSLKSVHTTAADGANLNYQFFAVQTRGADLVVSDFMASLVDPGVTNPSPGNYRGNPKTNEAGRYKYLFELNSTGVQPNTAPNGWAGEVASSPMVTYAENMLILAEAGARVEGFEAGLDRLNDFREYMSDGGYITDVDPAEVLYEPYVEADFQNGGMENQDGISQDNALLREILQERYITLFGQIEVFNDTRRTLSETIVRVPVIPNTGSQLPQRFIYPQSEIDRNSNVPDPIPGLFDVTTVNQ